jgi:outer membrane scaffolding protein for murein synthesis (MipA/OmpV family)
LLWLGKHHGIGTGCVYRAAAKSDSNTNVPPFTNTHADSYGTAFSHANSYAGASDPDTNTTASSAAPKHLDADASSNRG